VVSNKEINILRDSFQNEKEGSITFASGETSETLSFVPIEGTGWEMAVLIKESVINDQIHDISENNLRITRNQMIFTLVSVFLLAVILLLMLRKLSKDKLAEEKENSRAIQDMAKTDTMTGVRNKHAYTEFEAELNQKITDGTLDKLAVIVCDVNGLKHVNDTKGHAAGDQLIKDAANLLSEYFMHGSVFRIGGDEFVVLLQGKGYDKRQENIDEFNRKVESNIAQEAVVVSIGPATLQPGDRTLRDIFERADQLMYERKKQLKAMGAKTRE
ncbi:MAG: GGDEF domain-containing protein, partial [Lachnospiraceae bacterium]|nr:GGDEF domain-containing protein [Lachnospiraceae bacterium]